jgi:hypothetical protein
MAIEHARELDFSDNTSKHELFFFSWHYWLASVGAMLSPSRFMPPPLPDELCYYNGDPDDEADDFDDFDSEFS